MKALFAKVASSISLGLIFGATTFPAQAAEQVNIYSYRQSYLIEPMLDAFTKETGIKVNIVSDSKGLLERLKREGANSPADLVLAVDIGNLSEIANAGVTQAVQTDTLTKNIPAQYRDPEGHWYGLTLRARNLFIANDRVKPDAIQSYEDLADPKWKGKICTRSGKHQYNVALVASIIAHKGEAQAEQWLQGVKANLAQKPQGGDRAQVKALNEGVCDVALMNSYYYGNMLADPKEAPLAKAATMIFPNQADRGTHVNLSGVVLTKSAPNKKNAIKLMEYLSQEHAQRMYAELNSEYPVNPTVKPTGVVATWGDFKADELPLTEIAKHRDAAVRLLDKVDYDG